MAGLLGIAQRLGPVELIDKAAPKRGQGPSVGQYMVLAALNRALAPCSKLAIGDWYEETVLRRLWRLPKTAFSSQRFRDHKELTAIREVAVIYPQGTLAHRKDHITFSRMTPRQRRLAECLQIGEVLKG